MAVFFLFSIAFLAFAIFLVDMWLSNKPVSYDGHVEWTSNREQ